ncbi:hypothetical protein Zmor_023318 [Zophobas morio]|uniref:Uncharacterized protein n=1 Tax=Zophobas morio TaxID=2755281 RepID=A0AA38HZ80_9CUCU|nr:hypothetical protein Zmor_023318 [Zophobas morio]
MYVFITVTYILTNNILLVASVVPYYGISMYKIYVIAQIMTKVTAVNRNTTRVPLGTWGVVTQAEFGATGLELFSPHDGDSIYRKAYPTRISPLRTCPAELGHYGRQTRKRISAMGRSQEHRRPPLNLSKPVDLYRIRRGPKKKMKIVQLDRIMEYNRDTVDVSDRDDQN